MLAVDLEALEIALTDRLMSIDNTRFDPVEPLVRSVYNFIDGDQLPRGHPSVGIQHVGEEWADNKLLGGPVSQDGEESWNLHVLCPAPDLGGGIRGKRGVYSVTKQILEDIVGWQILAGCPIKQKRRQPFPVQNENGEFVLTAAYVLEISHPVYYEAD